LILEEALSAFSGHPGLLLRMRRSWQMMRIHCSWLCLFPTTALRPRCPFFKLTILFSILFFPLLLRHIRHDPRLPDETTESCKQVRMGTSALVSALNALPWEGDEEGSDSSEDDEPSRPPQAGRPKSKSKSY